MAVDFGQSILASSIALGGLLVIMAVVYFIWSRIGLKKKQKYFKELHVELAPGQEYSVTIPVFLDEVELEDWKQCSCELETRYYNQQGKDCFLGTLRATAKLSL